MKLLRSYFAVVVIVIGCSRCSHQNEKVLFKNRFDRNTEETAGADCITPTGEMGKCVHIQECPLLLAMITFPDQRDFLRQSNCGWVEDIPLVCCQKEIPTTTPRTCSFSDLHWCSSDPLDQCCIPAPTLNTTEKATTASPTVPSQCQPSSTPPERSSGCCGQYSEDRNIPGDTAALDQYPWTAIIEYEGFGTIQDKCGGALISSRYVLSAAHCLHFVNWTPLNIRLGDYDIEQPEIDCVNTERGEDCSDAAVTIPIEKTFRHPDYIVDSRMQANDIAVIRMKDDAPYTDFIKPICLPSSDISETATSSTRLTVAGWGLRRGVQTGHSRLKQQGDVQFVTAETCLMAYGQLNVVLDDGQICVDGDKEKKSCKGDSGGALMLKNQRTEIVGVASFPCGRASRPAVYTKVYYYLPWIRNIVI